MLDSEPTDLVPVVHRVVDRLAGLAERVGVPIELDLPGTPVIAEVDPRRVERVLRNLVGNAVEHGEARPVLITLGIDETAVAITVRDRGVGLKAGEEKLVFNRFWRADPSRARQTGGTGLGLSISLEDARLHGGWLEAWGAPGQGAQFRLTLPARAGDRLTTSPLRLVPADAALPFGGPRDGGPLAIGPGTGGALAIGPAPVGDGAADGGALVRRPTLLLGAFGALVLLGAGCGIPAASDVRVDGKGGAATEAGVISRGSEPPTRTASGSVNEAFVRNFLSAAAGEPDRAYERVKAFVAPEDKIRLQDKKGSEVALNVVRLREAVYTLNSDSTTTVEDRRAADRGAAGQRHPGPTGGDRDGVRVRPAQRVVQRRRSTTIGPASTSSTRPTCCCSATPPFASTTRTRRSTSGVRTAPAWCPTSATGRRRCRSSGGSTRW